MSVENSTCSCTEVTHREPPALFCDIQIGKDLTGNFALSYKGVAIQSDCGRRFLTFRVERDGVRIYDVTGLTLPGCDGFVYRVPVKKEQVRKYDLLLISECPLQVVFVEHIDPNTGRVKGITSSGNEVSYIPPVRLGECASYIRLVSILDVCGMESSEMSEEQIGLIAALLCCKPCGGGSYDYMPATVAQGWLSPAFPTAAPIAPVTSRL